MENTSLDLTQFLRFPLFTRYKTYSTLRSNTSTINNSKHAGIYAVPEQVENEASDPTYGGAVFVPVEKPSRRKASLPGKPPANV